MELVASRKHPGRGLMQLRGGHAAMTKQQWITFHDAMLRFNFRPEDRTTKTQRFFSPLEMVGAANHHDDWDMYKVAFPHSLEAH